MTFRCSKTEFRYIINDPLGIARPGLRTWPAVSIGICGREPEPWADLVLVFNFLIYMPI